MPALFCRRGDAVVDGRVPSITVTGAADALGIVGHARHEPDRPEVIAIVLEQRRAVAVVAVDNTARPDAVVDVVEFLAESLAAAGRPSELVLATVRPEVGPLPGDAERWMEASTIAENAGSELVEWFILSGEVAWCPRDLFGEPPRW